MSQKTEAVLRQLPQLAFAGPQELDVAIHQLQHIKSLREQIAEATTKMFGGPSDSSRGAQAAPSPRVVVASDRKGAVHERPLRRSRGKVPRPGSVRETIYQLLAGGIVQRRAIIQKVANIRNVEVAHAESLSDSVLSNPRDPYIRRVAVGTYRLLEAKRFLPKVSGPERTEPLSLVSETAAAPTAQAQAA